MKYFIDVMNKWLRGLRTIPLPERARCVQLYKPTLIHSSIQPRSLFISDLVEVHWSLFQATRELTRGAPAWVDGL